MKFSVHRRLDGMASWASPFGPLTAQEKRQAEVKGGLVVEGVNGPAERAGLQPGDLILSLNGKPVNSVEELRSLVEKGGKAVALLVQRDGGRRFVGIPLG